MAPDAPSHSRRDSGVPQRERHVPTVGLSPLEAMSWDQLVGDGGDIRSLVTGVHRTDLRRSADSGRRANRLSCDDDVLSGKVIRDGALCP